MMRYSTPILVMVLLIIVVGCKSQKNIKPIAPPETKNKTMLFSTTTSLLSVPITVQLNEIERQLNNGLSGLIYEDNTDDDDDLKYKIWKTGAITFNEKNGKIISSFPLKIDGSYKYGVSALGLSDTKKFSMNGVVEIESDTQLVNFKLTTRSHITSIKWKESPSIELFGKSVAITYLVNPALYFMKQKISSTIDVKITEYGDLKPYVIEGIKTICKPILVNEAYESWFYMTPIEIYSTTARVKNNSIHINLGLKCTVNTSIGIQPKDNFNANKLSFKVVKNIPTDFNINLAAVSTYQSAGKVITQNFKGEEFGSGNKKIVINNVALWENNNKIVIELSVEGSINGKIFLTGIPIFDKESEEIRFEDLAYELSTKNILLKSANWLVKSLVLNKIKENCSYSLKANLKEGKETFDNYLDNYSPSEGVYINGQTHSLTFEKLEFNQIGIVAFMNAKGEMKVTIENPKLN